MPIFTLTDDILSLAQDAFDCLIRELGRTARLYFAPLYIPCNNCGPNPLGNIPRTVWITGGPAYFANGSLCPLCGGDGSLQQEQYEDIRLIINWNPKEFDKEWLNSITRIPKDAIQAKGWISDLPKVSQCIYMHADIALQNLGNYHFKLISPPICPGNIIKHRYFTSIWERIPS